MTSSTRDVGAFCAKCHYEPAGPSGLCRACCPPTPRCLSCGRAWPEHPSGCCDQACADVLAVEMDRARAFDIEAQQQEASDEAEALRWRFGDPDRKW